MPLLPACGDVVIELQLEPVVNLSLVQMSPALCGSTQASVPSLTCQPGRHVLAIEIVPAVDRFAVEQQFPAGLLLFVV